jgi:pantothenate kinase
MTGSDFIDHLRALRDGTPAGARKVVAIAGAPASGKSTLAEAAVAALNAGEPGSAALLPMDGYHFDDEVLVPRGWRPRKGAPHTFDVGGYAAMLRRLRANAEAEVAVPRFDRSIEIARAGALLIPQSARIVVTEGNYLLLDEAPWTALAPLYDLTAMVAVPEAELARRLRARWVHFGLDEDGIRQKLEENDLPNGRMIVARSRRADIKIT